ncbi:MAG: hypothetical protein ACRELD_16620 [Longimicrobiales bacterium]
MSRILAQSLPGLAVLLLGFGYAGCNAFGITDEDENEVRVTVQALGADFLDANDGFRYTVDTSTEYEGYGSFADVQVGHVVEIEYEPIDSSSRRALEIEAEGASDD